MLNELKPGAVLTELGLAHEIGCSQGTVREALLRLQEDGLVVAHGPARHDRDPARPATKRRKCWRCGGASRCAAR